MARMKRGGHASTSPHSPDSSGGATTPKRVRTKETDGTPWYRISGWRLRNKIALALAFPVVSASWFATDKALEAFAVQHSHEATAGQVRVLAPALDFLYAAEHSYVQTMHTPPGSRQRVKAVAEVKRTAEELEKVSTSDALTENQQIQVKNLLKWAEDLQNVDVVRVATASNSQASQLHSAVADYFQTIVEEQVVPEAELQQISNVMDGHIALTQQRIYTEYNGDKIKNQADLLQYIGIERGAIESIADGRPAGDPDATNLRAQNVQRQAAVTLGKGEITYDNALDLYRAINAAVLDEAVAALDENAHDARGKALLNLWILTLAYFVTLILAWLIVRLILKPVRTVRDGALAVANEQLPRAVAQIRAGVEPDEIRPIAVHTHEEMGQLARAVDDLHRTAVNLASGEAQLRAQIGEMFVTLSRRNTSLINQQLGLIEELERDEQDPRRLESLFRLDHLAARMRRTAESLVILSDAPVRQRDSAPLAVTDVLQAATAGVQEYQRVELRGASSAQIEGAVANDVVHLLTELIDNALSFSPPTAPVQVTTTADSSAVTIAISDGGLGMPQDMLGQLNEMLGASVGITPDAARRMGLFVVSRLARRHDLTVRLAENGRGGVTATVTIPTGHVVGGAASLPAPAASQELPGATADVQVAPSAVVPEKRAPEPVIAATPLQPTSAAPTADPLTDPLPAGAATARTPVGRGPPPRPRRTRRVRSSSPTCRSGVREPRSRPEQRQSTPQGPRSSAASPSRPAGSSPGSSRTLPSPPRRPRRNRLRPGRPRRTPDAWSRRRPRSTPSTRPTQVGRAPRTTPRLPSRRGTSWRRPGKASSPSRRWRRRPRRRCRCARCLRWTRTSPSPRPPPGSRAASSHLPTRTPASQLRATGTRTRPPPPAWGSSTPSPGERSARELPLRRRRRRRRPRAAALPSTVRQCSTRVVPRLPRSLPRRPRPDRPTSRPPPRPAPSPRLPAPPGRRPSPPAGSGRVRATSPTARPMPAGPQQRRWRSTSRPRGPAPDFHSADRARGSSPVRSPRPAPCPPETPKPSVAGSPPMQLASPADGPRPSTPPIVHRKKARHDH